MAKRSSKNYLVTDNNNVLELWLRRRRYEVEAAGLGKPLCVRNKNGTLRVDTDGSLYSYKLKIGEFKPFEPVPTAYIWLYMSPHKFVSCTTSSHVSAACTLAEQLLDRVIYVNPATGEELFSGWKFYNTRERPELPIKHAPNTGVVWCRSCATVIEAMAKEGVRFAVKYRYGMRPKLLWFECPEVEKFYEFAASGNGWKSVARNLAKKLKRVQDGGIDALGPEMAAAYAEWLMEECGV